MKRVLSITIAIIIALSLNRALAYGNSGSGSMGRSKRSKGNSSGSYVSGSGSFVNYSGVNINDYDGSEENTIQYTDATTVSQVQEALNTAGFSCTVDGKYGPNTAQQITLYEKEKGLTEDGIITDTLLESLQITVTDEAKEYAEKVAYSTEYSWEDFARKPSEYSGVKAKFSGRILEADPSDSTSGNRWARMAVNDNIDTVFYLIIPSRLVDGRLLENDYITVYGKGSGTKTYIAVLGNEITIPELEVDYLEMN